jgi:organic radical activating enzyme
MDDYKDQKTNLDQTRKLLDDISPSMCLAKWTQLTLYLQIGMGHSCHHPLRHQIGLDEIENDPSALHNSFVKKITRGQMRKGKRPAECAFCWKVEDSDPNAHSDRIIKSAEEWSLIDYEKIKNQKVNENINPRYLEVSFSNKCNLACGYCSPYESNRIYEEYMEKGALPGRDIKYYEGLKFYQEEENPYIDAFWKWLPDAYKDLKVLRITGGEPMLAQSTFRILDHIQANPRPDLELSVNSNLMVGEKIIEKFLKKVKKLEESNAIKKFTLFVSVDSYGEQAEYIRDGLKYNIFIKNVDLFLSQLSKSTMTFMVTYSSFSVPKFKLLLEEVFKRKEKMHKEGKENYIILDTIPISLPEIFSHSNLNSKAYALIEEQYRYIQDHNQQKYDYGFNEVEELKFKRLLTRPQIDVALYKQRFKDFVAEFDKRRGKDFNSTFPKFWEMMD